MSIFSWENHDFRFLRLQWSSIVISKILDHDFLMKTLTNQTFFRKHTPPNVAILHLLVYSRTMLVDFSAQKVNFKKFRFRPIIKSMISLYKQNTRGAGPISFHKFWNFGKSFSWYRHSICHYEWPTNSQFWNIRAAYSPPPKTSQTSKVSVWNRRWYH